MSSDPRPDESSAAIEHVSDTALWVAMYRALESERPDAHFRDPYARRLAGSRGERILESMGGGRSSGWAMVVRTSLIDEILLRLARGPGMGVVLNLAAGLDARPWRLPLPSTLRWVDVDLPDMLAHKRSVLAGELASCRYQAEALDLRDRSLRRERLPALARGGAPGLVMTEGLLIYLAAEEVADLATDLHAIPELRWWLTDLVSPEAVRWLRRRWGRQLASAPFRFAPAEGSRFFEPFGWREVEFRSLWDEARRLRREMPHAWLWRLIARFAPPARREQLRRISGIVLLERV
jgi:methyltransferase (TIGR00027 family)